MSDNPGDFKPGNPHRFKPGQSGNPGGKPKGLERIVNDTIKAMTEEIEDPVTKAKVRIDGWERMARKLFDLGMAGNVQAMKLLFERAGGYPKQKVDLAAEVTTPQQFDFAALTPTQLEALAALDVPAGDDDDRTPTAH